MHAQLIHFVWKCVGNLVMFCRPWPYFNWTHVLTLIIRKNVSLYVSLSACMVDALRTPIFNIVCAGSVRPTISSTFRYVYVVDFFPGMPFVKE